MINVFSAFNWRLLPVVFASAIVVISAWFVYGLADKIAEQERIRIQHYGLAIESITRNEASGDASLASAMLVDNKSIPVIIADSLGNITEHINITKTSKSELEQAMKYYAGLHKPIVVDVQPRLYVYYGESNILRSLRFFPIVLFGIISIFFLVVWFAYRSANKAMQNKLWVGMSKETAHQLGTPIMSLMGWVNLLQEKGDKAIASEMQKDLERLQLVADRFSKIGSTPQLELEDVTQRVCNVVAYMQKRASKHVEIKVVDQFVEAPILLNGPLFDWVIENLIRNSLDAIEGKGTITISIENKPVEVIILVSDTGKGMTSDIAKRVFKPGFTTKLRGWGLGLSLSYRIIRTYHHGTLEVAQSVVGQGTTFRIVLRR